MTATTALDTHARTRDPLDGGSVTFTASALSLNVADVDASAAWVQKYLGFTTAMAADGFCSLEQPHAGFNLIYLRTGLPTFTPPAQAGPAGGLLVVFTVDDIDAEYARLISQDVEIVTPIHTEPWGERFFQMADPNGVVYQLVQWVTPEDRTE
ncbi:VOC family protein [Microbacterium sp. XT11]|uniref:VOC family protein n=1 Tax=Microbacterium sp. XT11 TaxID=367477 RepID=UPI000A6A6D2F|nr:VOC family protein [Microbacterium sp. XT11]